MKLEKLSAYEMIEKRYIEDLKSESFLMKHKKTGAKIALLSNDDENKVFYIGFRTPPKDSTGVPHIIEHTVLCGSKNFPVKDPFIELAKGSLNTFLNAMTFPDKTVYPVASCNDKDFQNLMHVYMDAVFYPNIYKEKKIFEQEGWHYELENPDDPITINGVVYSEMKGAFSSADDVLDREIMNSLFPDTSYGVESGGDPDTIPSLTYEQFLAFHQQFYHPCNSYIYLYGDMDMAEKLDWLDKEYLSHFDEAFIDSKIERQSAFKKVREVRREYPITESESEKDNAYLSYNCVVETSLDRDLYVAFQILDFAICSAPGAPLKTALIEKGIGKDVYGSYENGIYQPFFSVVAKNANEEQKAAFIATIEEVLQRLVKEGIDSKSLAAAINSFEFKYREADFGSYPKGLMYGLQVLDSWLYDDSLPFWHVEANETFKRLKERIGTGYYEALIEKYLLANSHKSIVTVVPVKGLATKKEKELETRLLEYKQRLSKEEIDKLIEETRLLTEYQEKEDEPEALKRIPLLKREDLKKEANAYSNVYDKIGDTLFLRHDYFTNSIGYIRISFECNDIPAELFAYVGILKSALGFMDTKNYSYGELFNEFNLLTGGMNTSLIVYSDVTNPTSYKAMFEFKTKVLYENMKEAFRLIEEVLFSTKLSDTKRLYEIIAENKSRMQSTMSSAGHSLAAMRAMSYFSNSAAVVELSSGIPYYRLLEKLEANFEEEKDKLIQNLNLLVKAIFRPEHVMLDYISPLADECGIRESFIHLKERLYTDEIVKAQLSVPVERKNEGFQTSAKIQYVCKAGNFVQKGLPYTGVLKVLRTIMGYEYMWNNVRVKGGAYGCMCSFPRSGDSYFVSYRDPNLSKTLEVYDNVVQYLEKFEADERAMTQFIIGTISDLDTPMNPAAKGSRDYAAYLSKMTYESAQRERDELLHTTSEDIRKMAPYMKAILEDECICVVGNADMISQVQNIFEKMEPLFH